VGSRLAGTIRHAYICGMSESNESTATGMPGSRVVIMNGFSDGEIMAIMRQVKALCRDGTSGQAAVDADRRDLIFAKTTPASLQTRLGDLIADLAGDHAYLQQNPPPVRGTPA
jgi:hypothetical protein